jgi:hypothetical protein
VEARRSYTHGGRRATSDGLEHISALVETALVFLQYIFERAALADGPMTGSVTPQQREASRGLDFVDAVRGGL